MSLPEGIQNWTDGHKSDHGTLKADYDVRHPDALLPELGGGLVDGRQSHDVIHELLAVDYNTEHGGNLQTELPAPPPYDGGPVAFVGSPASGHLAAHEALNKAYNDRHGEE